MRQSKIVLNWRQLQEIKFSMVYQRDLSHGANGHNSMIVMAEGMGFSLVGDDLYMEDTIIPLDDKDLKVEINNLTEEVNVSARGKE